jgi:hypothetical protein
VTVSAADSDAVAAASDPDDLDGHVLETTTRPGAAWDAMAASFADATFEQTAAYLAPRYSGDRLLGLLLRDGAGDVVACALAVLVVLPVLGAGLAYVKFGPLWRPAGQPAAAGRLVAMLRAIRMEICGRRRLALRLVPPVDPDAAAAWPAALREAGFAPSGVVADPERYFVDLTLDEATQRASLAAKWRANLVKAEAAGLALREGSLADDLPVFMRLFEGMLARKGFDDRHRIATAPAVLAALPAAFRPRLFLASAADEPVAATILVGGGERVFVPYSATAADAAPLRAGYALRWHVINALRGSGARWLDLGGCEGDPGLRHFKEGNVGKRGRVIDIPGEFSAAGSHLSESAAAAILGLRARADAPVLRRLYQELRRRA